MTMRAFTRHALSAAALAGLAACQGRIVLATDPPGAEVFAGNTRLGKTPLGLSESDLARAKAAGGYMVRIERNGYNRVLVLLPTGYRGVQVDLNLKPFATAPVATGSGSAAATFTAGQMAQLYADSALLLRMQSDMVESKAPSADDLKRLKEVYPDSGSAAMLEGLALYGKGDVSGARDALQEAVRRNPQEAEFRAILNEIAPGTAAPQATKSGDDAPATPDNTDSDQQTEE
jgi:hypothetical protein